MGCKTVCVPMKQKQKERVGLVGSDRRTIGAMLSSGKVRPHRTHLVSLAPSWMLSVLVTAVVVAMAGSGASGEYIREFEISEGAAVSSVIGLIGESDEAGQARPPPPPYLIVPVPGSAVDSDLNIEQSTGVISSKVVLDRELRSSYSLVAIPLSGENIRVVVSVKDENDNAPTFASDWLQIEFPENTPRDVKRTLPPAKDLDLDMFNTQRYNIMSGNTNNAFRLSSHRERDGVLYLDLQINGFLDRETTAFYSLVIEALDGGSPPLRGSMTVNITIQDVNDNQPIFNQSRYFASVAENATIGTSVLQVFATDTDEADNGRISYSINRRQSDRDSVFAIDARTGVISVNRPLDFETKEVHELVVVASDNGVQALETTAFVSIRVTDVNDNQPTINLIFLSDDATPKISEDAQPGEFVARISVNDPDSKEEYANVNVTLDGGDGHFGLTTRDNIIYLMIVELPLDRETGPNYTLVVTATDQGSPPLHASRQFDLRVTDTNDNAPQFDQSMYYANVLEVADPGTSVFQLSALDRDDGNNSLVSYSIVDSPDTHSHWFQIDARTGLITTRKHIDCETDPVPQITVLATDAGRPPLTATATVRVTIRDVNDNEPIFDQSFYNVSVREDDAVGHCILKVSATDPDCGVNAIVNYTMGDGLSKYREFQVNPSSGEICIGATLDHEKRSIYEFPILATDRGGLSTTAMVKIQVKDVNDNRPTFYPREYNVSLRERETVSSPVVVVVATDKDAGQFGSVRYAIVAGNQENLFRVESSSGEIFLTRPLTRAKLAHRLNISATDGAGLRSSHDALILITVIDSNHQPPIFDSNRYLFSVREDASRNTVIGTVSASSVTGSDSARYSIYSGDPNGYFSINPVTGTIRTDAELDHETRPFVLLNVAAMTGEPPTFGHSQVNITIGDVNDNAPEFDTSVVKISVAENAELGTPLYAAHARDSDGGDNGAVIYQLLSNPGKTFKLDLRQGFITLVRKLDFETTQRYSLVISAQDKGSPSLTSNLTLNIEVQDVNDNPPTFDQQEYQVNVAESLAVNAQFLQVNAVDLDTGNNARLTYRVKEEELADIFGIFPNSGSLYLKKSLDRERRDRYRLTVIATDNGLPPGSAAVTVNVFVTDTNDNDPVFTRQVYQFTIEENLDKGARVGVVSATDNDLDANAALRYTLLPANSSFQLNPLTGEIFTRMALDREAKAVHELQMEVKDQGNPPRSAKAVVRVLVTDVNDNTPVIIEPEETAIGVREELPPGTEVLRIRAIDTDEGNNASVTYSFVMGENTDGFDAFSIDESTGIIRTKVTLDHEERAFYRLAVSAKDQGRPSKESIRQLQIEVLDLNDNRPTFSTSSFSFKVEEGVKIGQEIGTVIAEDRDAGENGRVTYTILSGNVYGSFDFNMTTGVLFVAREIDRELASQYSLQVKAVDSSATNPQSNIINIKIDVVDVNDCAPQFKIDPVIFSIAENTAIATAVWNFSAVDLDDGVNGMIQYSLTQQWPVAVFKINSNSGILTLIHPLDHEQYPEFTIVVTATDQAEKERLSTSITARILVEDVNDNAPVFVSRTRVDIMEDEPIGYPLLHVIAIDRDSRDNGRVSYAVASGNEDAAFSLDPTSGILAVTRPLDRESQNRYQLNVTASDHGKPPKSSWQLIHIQVEDINDNPPHFLRSIYETSVAENAGVGTFVIKVSATDKDVGTNGNLTYSIPEGIADGKFSVDPATGSVVTSGAIDREDKSFYVVTVYVRDGSFPAQYDTTTVLISVVDVNDHAPEFGQSCYPLYIPENSDLSVIHTVVATDADSGPNGEITYSITGGNSGNKFSIDMHTGQLSSRPLDREVKDRYFLIITAQDRGSPSRQGFCNITVRVDDENDSDPRFTQSRYTASLAEDVQPDTIVLTVQATDGDRGNNAKITYSLSNETQWLFKIDNETGVLTTTGYFDRERRSSYTFEVRATDGGRYDARSEKAQIHISVTDVNDNKPVFIKYPFTADVPAFTQPSQQLLQITAEDKDEGANGEIVYSLINEPANSKFRIHPSSGVLTATTSLTVESGRLFHLQVLARDKGSPSLSSTGLIEIRVADAAGTDLNSAAQVALRFQNATYSVQLAENSPVGKDVIQVSAVRSDGRRQRVTYSFGSGNEENTFEINSNNGLIRVRDMKLDFESTPRLRLIVVAQAEGSSPSPLYGYATVWVDLLDRNDNSPRFTQDRYTAAVWEGNNKGTFVMQVSATDGDTGTNAEIVYHIVDGNHDNAFVIEPPFSGIVKTNIVLDREIRDSYRLTIIATDEGSPQLTGTCTLRINIVDVNDNQPTFPPHSVVSVSEGSEVGTVITTITANDVDTNPTLTYDFADGGNPNRMFSIDRFSGKITLAHPLDHERQQQYTLRVQASDMAHITETSITVNVLDENDNAPAFILQSYHATLPELTEPGYAVLSINATDADLGNNARVRYSLAISPTGSFYIGEDSGVIYTNQTLAFNPRQPVLQLVVKAEDGGRPAMSSVVAVRIQIADVNNNAPKFSQNIYTAHINEDATRGTIVLHVSAMDSDETRDNRNIDYSIEKGNVNSTFQITSDTGEILLVKTIDREQVSTFTLKVLAMDRGSPARNSTADVIIHVDDVNDNPPIFNQSLYEIKVSEAQAVGVALFRVAASDQDDGDNATLSYDITSGNDLDLFDMDSSTGVISLKRSLDFDKNAEHRFIIRASDGHATHPLSAIATVSVQVQDENDNMPIFPVSSYRQMVAENAPVGTLVFTAHANDMDRGAYGKLNYSIIGGEDGGKFQIDAATGAVVSNMIFDYELKNRYSLLLQAQDVGGQTASVSVRIDVESRDEFTPEFTESSYRFSMPVDAPVGYVIGQVLATDTDQGIDGRVVYHLRNQHPHLKINKLNGVITVRKRLDDTSTSSGASNANPRSGRRRRALAASVSGNSISVVVVATSGRPGSLSNMSVVEIMIDGAGNGTRLASADASGGLADWAMGLLIALIFLVLGFVAALVFLHMRHRKQQPVVLGGGAQSKAPMSVAASCSDPFDSQSQFDTLAFPPQYNEIPSYDHTERRHHVNTSEMSEQSHSASSGRGSAEEGEPEAEEDEEIRMINEGPLRHQQQQAKMQRLGLPMTTVPDSGIHGDDDNLSDVSVHNTQEYLARLGIDPLRSDPGLNCGVVQSDGSHSHSHTHMSHVGHVAGHGSSSHHNHSMNSMHLFDDDSAAQGDGMDLSNLIYAKLNEVGGDDPETVLDGPCNFGFGDSSQPSMNGSLSSIVHSEEELTGSYNWDYLLDWGPQYQPLAHVFGEIARLKDDSAPDGYGTNTNNKKPLNAQVKSMPLPPPLITNVAPRSIAPVALNTLLPVRSGQLAPMPSLPRSPINHEGSFTTSAMSPSFSPSLSPLANRSPSVSPLVPPGIAAGPKQMAAHHPRPPRTNVMITGASSSASETEMRL